MWNTRIRHLAALVCLGALAALPAGCARSGDAPAAAGAGDGTVATEAGGAPAAENTAPATQPKVIDPCSLVTREEAEKLAGIPLTDGRPVRSTCTYTAPPSGPTAQVEVFVGPGAKKILDVNRGLGHELRPLPGVGDEAYAEDKVVYVSKAGQWVSIRLVRLNDPAENRQPLEDLARLVAGRI